jgi:hypothetical protein
MQLIINSITTQIVLRIKHKFGSKPHYCTLHRDRVKGYSKLMANWWWWLKVSARGLRSLLVFYFLPPSVALCFPHNIYSLWAWGHSYTWPKLGRGKGTKLDEEDSIYYIRVACAPVFWSIWAPFRLLRIVPRAAAVVTRLRQCPPMLNTISAYLLFLIHIYLNSRMMHLPRSIWWMLSGTYQLCCLIRLFYIFFLH